MKKIHHLNFSISTDRRKGLNFKLSINVAVLLISILFLLLAFFIFLIFSYGKLNSQLVLNQALSGENKQLKIYNSKVKELEQELREYRLFAHQVAQIAGVKFPRDEDSIKDIKTEKLSLLSIKDTVFQLKTQKIPIFSTIPSGLPLQGKIIKNYSFGSNSKKEHSGIDISAKIGTEIKATADGLIDFVGKDKKYGNLVIINHENGYKTYYSSCSEIFAKEGDRVKRGEVIGLSGRTGRPTPHLHYEIRKDDIPLDPSEYIKSDSGVR
jgi:murein DD-endopeptidase MepM/ murein hydrolase activator NlpD